jgi:hypothetical protein
VPVLIGPRPDCDRFWTIARDDRPWGGGSAAVVYTYARAAGRPRAGAAEGLRASAERRYRAYKTAAEARRGDNGITLVHLGALPPAVLRHRQGSAGAD